MKKIFIFIFFLVLIFFGKEVNAVEESYYNLINMNQVEYNSSTDVFYSKQKINLAKGKSYTLVASSNFFGSVLDADSRALEDKSIGATFVNNLNNKLDLNFKLSVSSTGLHYATVSPDEDCILEFTDFLTKGYHLSNLPKSEILLFIGIKEDFKGFREVDHLDSYQKSENTIDIYTSIDSPIKVEEITGKIKAYDNEKGFSNDVILVKDDYQNATTLGEYKLVYRTTDNSNISSTLTINVRVVDKTPPTITGPDILEWDCYNYAPAPEIFKMEYKAFDNVDGDISHKISVANYTLAMYKRKVTKDYEVSLRVVDSSGNETIRNVILRAKDITAPSIILNDVNINLSSIGKSVFSDFYEQVISEITDNSEEYTKTVEAKEVIGKIGFSGVYQVTVTAFDKAGNKSVETANIRVIDDIAPEFYLQSDLLNITTEDVYDLEGIKEAISSDLYEDGILYDTVNLISCDYFSNEKNPGNYTVKYVYSYKGEANYMVGTITVTEPAATPPYWLLILLIPIAVGVLQLIKSRKELD